MARSKKAAQPPEVPRTLPVMPLRSTVVYPTGVMALQIGTETTLEMLALHPESGLLVVLVQAPGAPDDPVDPRAMAKIGVIARVTDRLHLPGGTQQVTVHGIRRVRVESVDRKDGHFRGRLEPAVEVPAADDRAEDLIAHVLTVLEALSQAVDRVPREVPRILRMNVMDPSRFADLVATLTNFSVQEKDAVLQILDVEQRLQYVLDELESQLHRVRALEDADEKEREAETGEERRRPGELRRRIRLLRAELGEVDPVEREVVDLLRRVEATPLPARVANRARLEVERLSLIPPAAPEATDIRTYVDWLLNLPWDSTATDGPAVIDIDAVQRSLDERTLGLEEPKNRLLDYLAVAKLRGDLRAPVPCLVGPPAVGKTVLAAALAEGLGRPLARLELGGRTAAYVGGSRRTRDWAQPGRLITALRDAAVQDPVFVLDEMDELGRGKPDDEVTDILEEVLEWESRGRFVDRYLDLEVDLRSVLFIAVAQDFYRIPRDLRDHMVEIRLAGYTPEEKVEIARQRLLPRLVEEHGLSSRDVAFSPEALFFLAQGYARDPGVGLLRRVLSTLLRTRARAKAEGDRKKWKFDQARVEEILGLPRFTSTVAENRPEVGVVTGLAWTASGGDLMFIEALRMPGSGKLLITGLLGDVMRESVNAAYSYVRSRADELGIVEDTFEEVDLHVHFPEGAIPKDGPSAGIAVTLALASTLSQRPVRHDMAMTGEVTLRGKVLDVGGIKEKVLAAYRAGIREIVLPSGNERDLRDVPEDVRAKMSFHFVARMEDVITLAMLGEPAEGEPRPRSTTVAVPRAAESARRGADEG